jgi:hypothetical protein
VTWTREKWCFLWLHKKFVQLISIFKNRRRKISIFAFGLQELSLVLRATAWVKCSRVELGGSWCV